MILTTKTGTTTSERKIDDSKLSNKEYQSQIEVSNYRPNDKEKKARALVLKHFGLGYDTMHTPRVEFNDLDVVDRMQVDQMSFNTYQANNGNPAEGDELGAWRSRAVKPIVRNKVISIASHATARLIFPKVFAQNEASDSQRESAGVMRDLMEWSGNQSNYGNTSLHAVLTALTDPASIVYTEYSEVYRNVKREKVNGKYREESILDPIFSGFQDTQVPVDELFIENFYEPDIQKQGWLIWRRVQSYAIAELKYQKYKNFQYVKPGMQTLYSDANESFYSVYDNHMQSEDVEEIIYYNKSLDLQLVLVNGVLLTDSDNANPRNDKLYPFAKFGYEVINNRCFYYKSLAFKLQQDADIVNTLYQIIIDGTYLNVFPAMIGVGSEEINSNVIIPGAVTTLADQNADLRPINSTSSGALNAGMTTMQVVEKSLSESSQDPLQNGQANSGTQTAYEISRLEQNSATVLGLFIKMISNYVRGYGQLRLGDILQYLTIIDVDKITDKSALVYKTFLLPTENGTKKIEFSEGVTDQPTNTDEALENSYKILSEEDRKDHQEIYKVNPELFRNLNYSISLDADVLNPRSEELERAFDLETYDRMINNPMADQEEAYRLLLSTNSKTRKDPDRFIKTADPLQNAQNEAQSPQGMPNAGNAPLNAVSSLIK